jgi:hypothetical protein
MDILQIIMADARRVNEYMKELYPHSAAGMMKVKSVAYLIITVGYTSKIPPPSVSAKAATKR